MVEEEATKHIDPKGKKIKDRIDTFGNTSFVKNPEPETDANTVNSKYPEI